MKLPLLRSHQSLLSVFISILFISAIIILLNFNHNSKYGVNAHMPTSNISRVQAWTDSQNGIKIQFMYEPEKPIIDTFTELKFSVENITIGDHISDTKDAVARVVVTNGQRLFNFENISVGNDGHFSVKYLFPDDGTHQAILRLDTKDSSIASSFNVFVPHQAPPNILNPFPSSPTADSNNQQIAMTVLLIGIIGGVAAISIFLIKRK
jgi:hypothetical protein